MNCQSIRTHLVERLNFLLHWVGEPHSQGALRAETIIGSLPAGWWCRALLGLLKALLVPRRLCTLCLGISVEWTMSRRGGWSRFLVVLFGLWHFPVQAQEQRQPSVGGAADAELANLGSQVNQLYQAGKYAQAIPIAERYAQGIEARHGTGGPEYALALNNLGLLLQATNRLAEAEPLMRRTIAIYEKSLGTDHPSVVVGLGNLALLLQAANRLAEAESLYRRALAASEKSLGPDHPNVALPLNNLAELLRVTNRLAEAEPLVRRALAIAEKSPGSEHPDVAGYVSTLALLLYATNRFSEAEPLMRRVIATFEKSLGPDHPNVALALSNLAQLLHVTNRLAEAEPLMRRALAIFEKSLGADHPNVGTALNNLALVLQATNRLTEAEPLMRRALTIDEKSLGPEHPDVAIHLNNLAILLKTTNRPAEVEPLMRRALAIFEKSLGADHPKVAAILGSLAVLSAERGDWAAAADLGKRAKPILIGHVDVDGGDRNGLGKALLASNALAFRIYARAIYRAGVESNASREEGFEVAQWALQTSAAQALSQMSARSAKGVGPLAQLVRDRQDMIARRDAEDKRLLAALGRGDAPATEISRRTVAMADSALDGIDARLSNEFREYAELANPKPLTTTAAQALLNDGEALILFLDVLQFGNLPGETLVWVVTRADTRWARIDLSSQGLAERAAALRCGLDHGSWEGEGKLRCLSLLAIDGEKAPDGSNRLPFDLTRAHQLYQTLFGQVADLIKDKHLLIVPSGPLTQIPFQVLVTEKPDPRATGNDAFRSAAWLAKSNAITVLPSVSSLQALRKHANTSHAAKPFVGFGNPLLDGPDARSGVRAEMARAKQQCPKSAWQRFPGQVAGGMKLLQPRSGLADVANVRAQVPLPETADELCAVARNLGVPDSDIWLGARANEREVKRLSESGELTAYRIVHFATHGALAGELKAGAEPGLILTPPGEATAEDDGYLSASEIAGLKLDADWVILSACNTAAGGAESAEALSGMSRAFFYAGARALLVSHWAVDSDATVKLITKTLSTMAADNTIGRSEALRRSMVALIEQGEPNEAHPAYWAPFVVVGEGGSPMPSQLTTQAIAPGPTSIVPPTKGPARAKTGRQKKEDWKTTIWR